MKRRTFLAVVLAWFTKRETSAEAWAQENARELPELAEAMAQFESEGATSEFERWRDKSYIGSVEWREGVTLAYGFSGRLRYLPPVDQVRDAFEAAEFRCLCDGRSEDGRAWTLFVLAAAHDAQDVLRTSFPGNREERWGRFIADDARRATR